MKFCHNRKRFSFTPPNTYKKYFTEALFGREGYLYSSKYKTRHLGQSAENYLKSFTNFYQICMHFSIVLSILYWKTKQNNKTTQKQKTEEKAHLKGEKAICDSFSPLS